MEKVRESYLDAARGACVLSVMFIHTVYWSGGSYVPEFLRTLALLLDVPAFFFLAGVTLGVTGKSRVPAAVFSFMFYFAVLGLVHDALAGEWTFINLIRCLTLETPQMQYLPVVGGSYWFVPVYVVAALVSAALIECAPRVVAPLVGLLFGYYALEFFFFPQWRDLPFQFLSINIHYLMFYLGLILFGWLAWRHWLSGGQRKLFLALPVLGLAFFFAAWLQDGNKVFILQNFKFQPQLPYVALSFISIGVICALWSNARSNRVLEYMGRNALAWYAGQGVGASLLMFTASSVALPWPLKMTLLFGLNVLCSGLVAFLLLRLDKASRVWLRPAVKTS